MMDLHELLDQMKFSTEEKRNWLELYDTMTEEGQRELYKMLLQQNK